MLFQSHNFAVLALAGALLASACSASLSDPAPSTEREQASKRMGNDVTDTDLPVSKRYATLDAYLAYLEKYQGPVDGPWYKEVSPGSYELQTGNLRVLGASEEKRIFSRDELEKKFGFSK